MLNSKTMIARKALPGIMGPSGLITNTNRSINTETRL
jgi:hypothetical protein